MSEIVNITKRPFAQYSAEEELEGLKFFYYEQQYYHELIDLSKEGVSRFILGQRGQGKSATIYHLLDDLKRHSILPVLITRYDGYSETKNENYYLYSIIQGLTFGIAKKLYQDKKSRKKLSKVQQNALAVFIEAFYDSHCGDEFINASKEVIKKNRLNFFKNVWNNLFKKPVNSLIGTGVQITAQMIQNSIGVSQDITYTSREYIEGFTLEAINQKSKEEIVAWPTEKLVKIIHNLISVANNLGFETIVVLFDKIDEVRNINSDIDKVADFMIDILSDTEFLYTSKLSIVVSLWSEIKNALNKKGVRFDKFKNIDIRWKNEELISLINKRLYYYSDNKQNTVTFESLIPNRQNRETILQISDKSPRSLITLLSYIQSEETSKSPVSSFSDEAISKGCVAYCKKFDYLSLQPSRTGKSTDLLNWINKLLRMKLIKFTLKQYTEYYKVSSTKLGNRHINSLIKLNLVRDSLYPGDEGEILYEIIDPRITYLITRGELNLDI